MDMDYQTITSALNAIKREYWLKGSWDTYNFGTGLGVSAQYDPNYSGSTKEIISLEDKRIFSQLSSPVRFYYGLSSESTQSNSINLNNRFYFQEGILNDIYYSNILDRYILTAENRTSAVEDFSLVLYQSSFYANSLNGNIRDLFIKIASNLSSSIPPGVEYPDTYTSTVHENSIDYNIDGSFPKIELREYISEAKLSNNLFTIEEWSSTSLKYIADINEINITAFNDNNSYGPYGQTSSIYFIFDFEFNNINCIDLTPGAPFGLNPYVFKNFLYNYKQNTFDYSHIVNNMTIKNIFHCHGEVIVDKTNGRIDTCRITFPNYRYGDNDEYQYTEEFTQTDPFQSGAQFPLDKTMTCRIYTGYSGNIFDKYVNFLNYINQMASVGSNIKDFSKKNISFDIKSNKKEEAVSIGDIKKEKIMKKADSLDSTFRFLNNSCRMTSINYSDNKENTNKKFIDILRK